MRRNGADHHLEQGWVSTIDRDKFELSTQHQQAVPIALKGRTLPFAWWNGLCCHVGRRTFPHLMRRRCLSALSPDQSAFITRSQY